MENSKPTLNKRGKMLAAAIAGGSLGAMLGGVLASKKEKENRSAIVATAGMYGAIIGMIGNLAAQELKSMDKMMNEVHKEDLDRDNKSAEKPPMK